MKRHPALVPLSREHNTALVLALRIQREVPTGDAENVRAVYNDLISFWARGLLPHFHAENECLLARLVRHIPDSDELIQRTERDHLAIEALVANIRDEPDLERRRRRLMEFADQIKTHIRWEESDLFEAAQAHLTEQELGTLGEEIAERIGDGVSDACATPEQLPGEG